MAYIDPEGMFGGDRMAMLSDQARYAWPWFWCASNTCGRVELNYRAFISGPFRQFKKPPTEQQFWDLVTEFHESHLMFAYQAEGSAWGQWDVSSEYLPKYKLKADERTPAPVAKDFLEWRDEYQDSKKAAISSKCRVFNISGNFQNPAKISEDSEKFAIGEERRGEGNITAAFAAKTPLFPVPLTIDQVIRETAERISGRHPRGRGCTPEKTERLLRAILKLHPKAVWTPRLEQIDSNHKGWCESEDWTKENGKFAKGLAGWLALTEQRYDVPPPRARDSPRPATPEELLQRPLRLWNGKLEPEDPNLPSI